VAVEEEMAVAGTDVALVSFVDDNIEPMRQLVCQASGQEIARFLVPRNGRGVPGEPLEWSWSS
jgi:hypothetical protein